MRKTQKSKKLSQKRNNKSQKSNASNSSLPFKLRQAIESYNSQERSRNNNDEKENSRTITIDELNDLVDRRYEGKLSEVHLDTLSKLQTLQNTYLDTPIVSDILYVFSELIKFSKTDRVEIDYVKDSDIMKFGTETVWDDGNFTREERKVYKKYINYVMRCLKSDRILELVELPITYYKILEKMGNLLHEPSESKFINILDNEKNQRAESINEAEIVN